MARHFPAPAHPPHPPATAHIRGFDVPPLPPAATRRHNPRYWCEPAPQQKGVRVGSPWWVEFAPENDDRHFDDTPKDAVILTKFASRYMPGQFHQECLKVCARRLELGQANCTPLQNACRYLRKTLMNLDTSLATMHINRANYILTVSDAYFNATASPAFRKLQKSKHIPTISRT